MQKNAKKNAPCITAKEGSMARGMWAVALRALLCVALAVSFVPSASIAPAYAADGATCTSAATQATQADTTSTATTQAVATSATSTAATQTTTQTTTIDTSWYNTTSTSFTISSGEQLAGLAAIVNGTAEGIAQDSFASKTLTLANDIDISAYEQWETIGTITVTSLTSVTPGYAFAGTFDGNNFSISGLSATDETVGMALFGYSTGTICNLTVEGSIRGYSYTAGVVAYGGGAIYNVVNRVAIYSEGNYVGGILGDVKGSVTITDCTNEGEITNGASSAEKSTGRVGGIVGRAESGNSAVISRCANVANITAYQYIGGIIGGSFGDVSVDCCYNTGTLRGISFGKVYLGGIAGKLGGGTISNCYNWGTISDTPWNQGHIRAVGGITGCEQDHTVGMAITNCYNAGTITLDTQYQVEGVNYIYMVGNISGGNSSTSYNTMTYKNCFYLQGSFAALSDSTYFWADVYLEDPLIWETEYVTGCTEDELRSIEVLNALGVYFTAAEGQDEEGDAGQGDGEGADGDASQGDGDASQTADGQDTDGDADQAGDGEGAEGTESSQASETSDVSEKGFPVLYWQLGLPEPDSVSYSLNAEVLGGTATIGIAEEAAAGADVEFTISNIEAGLQIASVSALDAAGANIAVTETDGVYSFSMPARAVSITVLLENVVSEEASYAVKLPTLSSSIWSLDLTCNYLSDDLVTAGATVFLYVEKSDDAATTFLDGVSVVGVSGTEYATTHLSANLYSFTMPKEAVVVNIEASYSELEVSLQVNGEIESYISISRAELLSLATVGSRVYYTGWSSETSPFVAATDSYVSLETLLAALDISFEPADSIAVTCADGFTQTYTYEYLIETPRYYYADIMENATAATEKSLFEPLLVISGNKTTDASAVASMECDTLYAYQLAFGQSEEELTSAYKITDKMPKCITQICIVHEDTPQTYAISYELNGGTLSDDAASTYIAGSGLSELPVPTREGYTFCGWVNAEGSLVTSISADACEDVVLTATWEKRVSRLAGSNRYATMAKISERAFPNGCDAVIVCRGNNFPDALAAAGLAGVVEGQVLLTTTKSLSAQTAAEIARLGASTVYVIGDTNSVSAKTFASIKAISCVQTVTRIAGSDRYSTAVEIYKQGAQLEGGWGEVAIVATGTKAADSLSASSVAYALDAPIFLVNKTGSLSASAMAAIKSGNFKTILVLGDTNSVSSATKESLESAAETVKRLAGSNRYETSIKVADWAMQYADFTCAHAAVTAGSGSKYADALAASALCGKSKSPVLLVKATETSNEAVEALLSANKLTVESVYVLGDAASVTDKMFSAVEVAVALDGETSDADGGEGDSIDGEDGEDTDGGETDDPDGEGDGSDSGDGEGSGGEGEGSDGGDDEDPDGEEGEGEGETDDPNKDNDSWYNTEDTEFTISTADQLREFAAIVNGEAEGIEQDSFEGKTVTLACDIALDEDGKYTCIADVVYGTSSYPMTIDQYVVNEGAAIWTPIGSGAASSNTGASTANAFAGTFDGAGHTISGVYTGTTDVTAANTVTVQGLFGVVTGTVRNLTVSGCITGKIVVGGVVAHLASGGVVENCTNNAVVFADGGTTPGGAVENGVSRGGAVGGIVGNAETGARVSGCLNNETVLCANTKNGGRVGGIVGLADEAGISISCCGNTAAVEGYQYIGGILGYSYQLVLSYIDQCFNTGYVRGSSRGSSYAGGITSKFTGEITNCYNRGNVTVIITTSDKTAHLGGIVSDLDSGTVTNCYNTGECLKSVALMSSYGAICGTGYGYDTSNSPLVNCYAPSTLEYEDFGYYTSLSEEVMKSASLASLLGSAFTWVEGENDSFPMLAWQVQ